MSWSVFLQIGSWAFSSPLQQSLDGECPLTNMTCAVVHFNKCLSWSCRFLECSTFFWMASCWYCRCVVMIDIFLRLSSECRIASSWITMFLAACPNSSWLREPLSTWRVRPITSPLHEPTLSDSKPLTDWPNRGCDSAEAIIVGKLQGSSTSRNNILPDKRDRKSVV